MHKLIRLMATDLRTLPKWVLGSLIVFLSAITWTSFSNSNNPVAWQVVSFAAATTSIICVLLIANRKLSNFCWGFFSCLFYALYCGKYQYYGDLVTNLFGYLPMCFYGFYCGKNGYNSRIGKIFRNRMNADAYCILILLTAITYPLFFFITPLFSEIGNWKGYGAQYTHYLTGRHAFDAFTSMGAIVSTVFLNARLPVDNIYYLLMNPASIALWAHFGDVAMVITYSVYFAISCIGIWDGYGRQQ